MKNSKTKAQLLEELRNDIIKTKVCPELAASATQLVFGDGSPEAEIMFIGEAPGKNEDQQGLPFVGAAGKFLNDMLGSINLKRKEVYITNIVKYRPPDNRDPLPAEKKAFLPFLWRQIVAIRPKLIVTLGRHSMESFLPGASISTVHGQPKRIRLQVTGDRLQKNADKQAVMSLVILPLFHPAAALYNGGMRQTLLDDFAKIPLILKRIATETTK